MATLSFHKANIICVTRTQMKNSGRGSRVPASTLVLLVLGIPQGWPSAFGPTGYIFRKAPVITQETVCFQKPVLAAIAISKQEGENVCEGVILCVGEKRF